MATITIRNVPDELVGRIKRQAEQKGISMEQEIRDLLQSRYVQRTAVIERIRCSLADSTDSNCKPSARLERARATLMVIDTMVGIVIDVWVMVWGFKQSKQLLHENNISKTLPHPECPQCL